jgi:glycosyl transferase family 25
MESKTQRTVPKALCGDVMPAQRKELTVLPTYLINLDHRPDRLVAAGVAAANMGINFTRVSAVDTRHQTEFTKDKVSPDAAESIKRGYRLEHHELSAGSVGCYLSHMKCWELIKASGAPAGLVFEDDIVYSGTQEEFNRALHIANEEVTHNGVDIFLLGNIIQLPGVTADSRKVIPVEKFFCTHAYVISAVACDKLLAVALPMYYQLDSFMSKLNSAHVLQTKAIVPSLVQQSCLDTDIQTPYKGS